MVEHLRSDVETLLIPMGGSETPVKHMIQSRQLIQVI
jgi:hypothetical protein